MPAFRARHQEKGQILAPESHQDEKDERDENSISSPFYENPWSAHKGKDRRQGHSLAETLRPLQLWHRELEWFA